MSGPASGQRLTDAPARALLRRLPHTAMIVLDRDTRVLLCEGGAFGPVGWDTASIGGRRLRDILSADSWAFFEPHYLAALDGDTRSFHYAGRTGRYFRVVASPVTGADGEVEAVLVVAVDDTEEHEAERRIRQSQTLLRAAFDAAGTAIVVFSIQPTVFGRLMQANAATSRLLGYHADDISGRSLRDVLPPEEAEELEGELRRAAADGAELNGIERSLVDSRGRRLWGRLHVSFVRDDDGRPTHGVLLIEDITRERLREEALRFSKERFGLVFHQAPVGMTMVDLRPGNRGTILEANRAFAELVGLPMSDLPGTSTHEFTHPDDLESTTDVLDRLAGGETDHVVFDKRYLRPDGSTRTARLRVGVIVDGGGTPLYGIGVAADVTELRRAQTAREGLLESVLEAVLGADAEGNVVTMNRAAEELFGTTRDAVMGRSSLELFVPPELRGFMRAGMVRMRHADPEALATEIVETNLQRMDGTRFPAQISFRRTGHEPVEFSVCVRDLTAEQQAERRRRGAEDMFRSIFESSAIAMAITNLTGLCLEANSELCRFLGRGAEELRHLTIADVTHPDDHVPTADLVAALEEHGTLHREKRFVRGDGEVVWGVVHSSLLIDEHGRPRGIQSQIVDSTRQHHSDARFGAVLESLAEGVLVVGGGGEIESANPAAVRMLGPRGEETVVGRTLAEVLDEDAAAAVAALADDAPPIRVEDASLRRGDGSLLPASFSASPLSDGRGSGIVLVFSDISERKAREHNLRRRLSALDILEQTRTALRTDRLVLYTQPILDIAAGEIVQEELLLRMLDEDGRVVPPGDFLPVAEEYGLIAEIDRWVIGEAARMAACGRHVEVNVSGKTLGHRDLTRWVDEALADSGADPENITFEITETALTSDLEQAARFAEHVAALGCHFALDDFGTGYGSFTLLKRLPVSYLKIDMEFVRNLVAEDADRHVVQAVVSLARGLDMRTIAEGVEEQVTLDLLAEMGVDYAQGYLIGRPGPPEGAVPG